MSTTIYDNPESHAAKKKLDKTLPQLPPLRQPENSASPTGTNTGYEYISVSHNQSTATEYSTPVDSLLLPKISKSNCYESFSESQAISIDFSKNVVHWQKKCKEKDESLSQCNPYEEPVNIGELVYEDPGTSKEKIYAYFEQRKFRKISLMDLR